MSSHVETLIERVMGELHRIVRTETVVGEPLQAGGVTLIPVSKISLGFGAGGGREEKGQSGTGGGALVEPVAFVVIDADGKVQIMTLKDKEIGLGQLAKLVPEAVDKLQKLMGKKRHAKGQDDGESEGEDDV
jgi:uncharacterized spore protein YtfJ